MRPEIKIEEAKKQHELQLRRARYDIFWSAYVKESAHVLPDEERLILARCVLTELGLATGEDAIDIAKLDFNKKFRDRVEYVVDSINRPVAIINSKYRDAKNKMISLSREGLERHRYLAEPIDDHSTTDFLGMGSSFYDKFFKK